MYQSEFDSIPRSLKYFRKYLGTLYNAALDPPLLRVTWSPRHAERRELARRGRRSCIGHVARPCI